MHTVLSCASSAALAALLALAWSHAWVDLAAFSQGPRGVGRGHGVANNPSPLPLTHPMRVFDRWASRCVFDRWASRCAGRGCREKEEVGAAAKKVEEAAAKVDGAKADLEKAGCQPGSTDAKCVALLDALAQAEANLGKAETELQTAKDSLAGSQDPGAAWTTKVTTTTTTTTTGACASVCVGKGGPKKWKRMLP